MQHDQPKGDLSQSSSWTRREACTLLGAAGWAALNPGLFAAAAEEKSLPLRVIAYNVYGCTGWPGDRERARRAVARHQMADRFALELALYDPDLIVFSESPDRRLTDAIAKRMGMKSVRFPSGLKWPGTLLTRFEITASQNAPVAGGKRPEDLFTRHWGRAEIRLSRGADLVVHSAHLHPSKSAIRQREIAAMVETMDDDLQSERPMLLLGDLNHEPDTVEYRRWTEAGFVDTFAKVGAGKGPTIKADEPKRRIDYVFAAGPLAEKVSESRPLFEGAFRTNPADPRSFALSDHLPQFAVFKP